MKAALQKLLDGFDTIFEKYEEVHDTDVREQLAAAVYHGFIMKTPGYYLPAEFGMFHDEADVAVRAALVDFLAEANAAELSTAEERFSAFQDVSVVSHGGCAYDEFFGHSASLEEWVRGMSRPALPLTEPPAKQWWQFW